MNIKELLSSKEAGTYTVEALMVKVSLETGKNGQQYTLATFQDKFGVIEARRWDTDLADKCEANTVLSLDLEAKEYNGKLNYTVKNFTLLPEAKIEDYSGDFTPDVESLKTYLRETFAEVYKNQEFAYMLNTLFGIDKGNFFVFPAAKAMHHDLKHGLLFHTVAMLKHAKGLINSTKEMYGKALNIDEKLVYTAIIIHDYFKIKEYDINEAYKADITKYATIGHITMATGFIAAMYYQGKMSEETYIKLTNAVAAHHGQLEYGSPVVPATIEAQIVHTVDMFDSRVYMFADELRKIDDGQLSLTKNFGLGTNVYK